MEIFDFWGRDARAYGTHLRAPIEVKFRTARRTMPYFMYSVPQTPSWWGGVLAAGAAPSRTPPPLSAIDPGLELPLFGPHLRLFCVPPQCLSPWFRLAIAPAQLGKNTVLPQRIGEGVGCPLPKNPTPLSALWASEFGTLGRSFLRIGRKNPGNGPTIGATSRP